MQQSLSGGEPTLHHDFLEIVGMAANSVNNLVIHTNGLRLSREDFCLSLKEVAPNAVVAISLDSPDPIANDSSRGMGGARAKVAIENCVAAGLSTYVSAVLTESTISSAAKLIGQFAPGVRTFKFFPRVPRNNQDIMLNSGSYIESVDRFYDDLCDIATANADLQILIPSGNARDWRSHAERVLTAECVCAQTRIYIDRNFDVFPCYYSAAFDNCFGSCKSTSLRSLWNCEKADSIKERALQERICGARSDVPTIPIRYQTNNIGQKRV